MEGTVDFVRLKIVKIWSIEHEDKALIEAIVEQQERHCPGSQRRLKERKESSLPRSLLRSRLAQTNRRSSTLTS